MPSGVSQLLNVKNAGIFLGVHPNTIRRWARNKKLKAVKVGSRGDWRFTKKNLLNMVSQDKIQITHANEIDQSSINILESIPDGFVSYDKEWRYVYINKKAASMANVKQEDIIGRRVHQVFPANVKSPVFRKHQQVMKSGKATQIEYFSPGAKRWIRAHLYPSSHGMTTFLVDITNERKIQDNLRFLSEAGKILLSSIDYNKTLSAVAKLGIPYIADWVVIDLVDENGRLQQVEISSADTKKAELLKKVRDKYPPNMKSKTGLAHLLRSGKSVLHEKTPENLFKQIARSPEHLSILLSTNIISMILVPMILRKKIIGVIQFASTQKYYTKEDLSMAEELASKASLAITNARLYDKSQQEIAEREKKQKELTDIKYALDQSSIVAITDKEGVIQYVNDKFLEISKYSREELINKTHRVINSDFHSDEFMNNLWSTIGSGKVWHGEIRNRTKYGKYYWVDTTITPLLDEKGKPRQFIAIRNDITRRVELESQKDEFLSIASHELKTPLTSLKAFSQLLERHEHTKKDTKVINYVKRMNIQLDKLSTIVSDLLDVSRIEEGRLRLVKDRFTYDKLVTEIINDIQVTSGSHKIYKYGKASIKITADKFRLGQVLINFLTNGIKYSKDSKKIIVRVKVDSKKITTSVQDFGIGIPKNLQSHIFEKFYRAHTKYPGLGLGLYISRQIIERYKGTVWMESKKGKGSTFYFSIPLESVQT